MKKVGEYWYPDTEERLHRSHARVGDIAQFIMPHIERTRCVVQAGGAAGVWPIEFARYFSEVYSFEPNPALVECFYRNLEKSPDRDRVCLNTHGLWKEPDYGEMVHHEENNMGSWYFQPQHEGSVYVDTIDSYDLHEVDLIPLDIEGAEFEALLGAKDTIRRCKPTLVLEIKFTQDFYNRTVEDLYTLLFDLGYKTHSKWARDQMWIPRSP